MIDTDRSLDLAPLAPRVSLWVPRIWGWMQQHPELNIDDDGPQSLGAFAKDMQERQGTEAMWGVTDTEPCGIIALKPLTPRTAIFHGICFDEAVWGTGVAEHAVRHVMVNAWEAGIEKIGAIFFAHNRRVARFLDKRGFVDEGVLKAQAMQHGKPIDLRIMAAFRPTDGKD